MRACMHVRLCVRARVHACVDVYARCCMHVHVGVCAGRRVHKLYCIIAL